MCTWNGELCYIASCQLEPPGDLCRHPSHPRLITLEYLEVCTWMKLPGRIQSWEPLPPQAGRGFTELRMSLSIPSPTDSFPFFFLCFTSSDAMHFSSFSFLHPHSSSPPPLPKSQTTWHFCELQTSPKVWDKRLWHLKNMFEKPYIEYSTCQCLDVFGYPNICLNLLSYKSILAYQIYSHFYIWQFSPPPHWQTSHTKKSFKFYFFLFLFPPVSKNKRMLSKKNSKVFHQHPYHQHYTYT